MTDFETPPVDCPNCGATVRDDVPPVDCLTTCDNCGHRFWIRPIDPFDQPDDELPPGMLGIVRLNGGGTATVCGNLRGNDLITSQRQATAASRVFGASNVVQNATLNIDWNDDARQFQGRQKRGNR